MDKMKYNSGTEKRKRRSAVEDAGASLQKLTTFFSPETTTTVTPISPTTAEECSEFQTEGVARPAPALLAPITIESEVLGNILINAATTCVNEDVTNVSSDPANWVVTDELCEEIIRRPAIVQNLGDFSKSERAGKTHKRYLPPTLFQRTMANSETVRREWLSYSMSTGNV